MGPHADTGLAVDRKNFTYYLNQALVAKAARRAKIEGRSTNREIEVMIATYLRNKGDDLGPDFPDPDSPA